KQTELLEHRELVHDVPVLGELAVLDAIDVDPRDLEALPGRGNTEELRDVRAGVRPTNDNAVPLGDDVLERETRLESHAEHRDAVLEALSSRALTGQRVVLRVAGRRDLVDHADLAAVEDVLIQ